LVVVASLPHLRLHASKGMCYDVGVKTMPARDHWRTTDFADVALGFATYKCRLAEAEELVCASSECMDMPLDEIRPREA